MSFTAFCRRPSLVPQAGHVLPPKPNHHPHTNNLRDPSLHFAFYSRINSNRLTPTELVEQARPMTILIARTANDSVLFC
jgi:hypothetical protein